MVEKINDTVFVYFQALCCMWLQALCCTFTLKHFTESSFSSYGERRVNWSKCLLGLAQRSTVHYVDVSIESWSVGDLFAFRSSLKYASSRQQMFISDRIRCCWSKKKWKMFNNEGVIQTCLDQAAKHCLLKKGGTFQGSNGIQKQGGQTLTILMLCIKSQSVFGVYHYPCPTVHMVHWWPMSWSVHDPCLSVDVLW